MTGGTTLLFKNMDGFYEVYQCPRCLKVVFVKERVLGKVFCCECNVEMKKIDLKTAKVEIQL